MPDWLKQVAPTLASALLGPAAGLAVTALGNVLNISEPTKDRVMAAIANAQMSPEQIVALKQAELVAQQQEREIGFKFAELEFKDRDSARNMAIQTHAYTPAILTWIIVVLVLVFEGSAMFHGIPNEVSDIVAGRVLGTLDSSLLMVLAFWFGSNSSSSRKTELLASAPSIK